MRVLIIAAFVIICGCGGTRYNPMKTTDYVIHRTLYREPTEHEKRTYEIYKDNPKKLKRWLRELEKRNQ